MPIRMVDDEPKSNSSNRSSSSKNKGVGRFSGGGSNGILGNVLGAALPYLLKRPKLLVVLVIVGIALYFFMGRGCSGLLISSDTVSQFVRGGELDKEIYENTEIYEPLADNKKNPLPERVSLQKYCPIPMNQGQQGSCVAWASAYAARTILEAARTGKDPNSVKFSPSYLYNQIALEDCQGSYVKYAMDNMHDKGAVSLKDFAYDDRDCSRQPTADLRSKAANFKIKGFQRLTEEKKGKSYEMLGIKQNLAKGSPVVIGMMVGGSFMSNMMGKEYWFPTNSDYSKSGFGGHAMCVIGYDDYLNGGSFQLMNSWGTDWGKGGFAWIRYADFKEFNVEAYGLYPMGNADRVQPTSFSGSFGLELNSGKKTIALREAGNNYFETTNKLSSDDKFKVEFTNTIECYTYVFGEETNGTSYVLFPNTPKHSPYCGITGTRLFPRDQSMQPDKIGTKDKFAVVITRAPIDYDQMNKAITSAKGNDFQSKIENALGNQVDNEIRFTQQGNLIQFNTDLNNTKAAFFVIGVNK
ncbi:MAG: C1 family peptidase [Crocinitomicaceae bacterium]